MSNSFITWGNCSVCFDFSPAGMSGMGMNSFGRRIVSLDGVVGRTWCSLGYFSTLLVV